MGILVHNSLEPNQGPKGDWRQARAGHSCPRVMCAPLPACLGPHLCNTSASAVRMTHMLQVQLLYVSPNVASSPELGKREVAFFRGSSVPFWAKRRQCVKLDQNKITIETYKETLSWGSINNKMWWACWFYWFCFQYAFIILAHPPPPHTQLQSIPETSTVPLQRWGN